MLTAKKRDLILYLVILVIVAVSWLLPACIGRTANPHAGAPGAGQFPEELTVDDLTAADDVIPFPDELAEWAAAEEARQGSAVEDLTLLGNDYYKRHNDATIDGDRLVLTATAGNICWGMYRFAGLADEDLAQSVSVEFAAPLPERYFLGLADFESGVWMWQECTNTTTSTSETSAVDVPPLLDTISDGGYLYATIVVWNDASETIDNVTLTADIDQGAPVAQLEAGSYRINRPEDAVLIASGSVDRDGGGIVGYEWDWEGDGTFDLSGTNDTETVNYADCGIYQPVVRVTDGAGNTDIARALVVVQSWSHSWGSDGSDCIEDITIGPDGQIYATGYFTSTTAFKELFVSQYSQYGDLNWRLAWGDEEYDYGALVLVDDDGNIYVLGTSTSYSAIGADLLIIKLDKDRNLLWSEVWGSEANETCGGAIFTADGNLNIVGETTGFAADDNGDLFYLVVDPDGSVLTQKLWSASDEGDHPFDITKDGSGNLYVCGRTNHSGSTLSDALLLKLDSSLNLVWQKAIAPTTLRLRANAIDLDYDGGIYLTGARYDAISASDVVVIKVNSDGTPGWCKIREDQQDLGCDITVIGGSFMPIHIYLLGYDFTSDEQTLLASFNGSGECQWQREWLAAEDNHGCGLARGEYGALFFGGAAKWAAGNWSSVSQAWTDESITIKNISGAFQNIVGTHTMVTGTLYEPAGTTDTGGGGSDALIGGWFTEDW
ncbi:hypothetical protein JW859_04200 [bacterium]|nr:hypothetical protein [bacterium]